ncbi:MAG: cobalamin-dependent protein [Burkholderiales bacterium]|nr:cobalamin-dependent protein [Burkholderiales bacterium]
MTALSQHVLGLDCAGAVGEASPDAEGVAQAGPRERVALLVQTIERDIIPRLMLAHREGDAARAVAADAVPTDRDVEILVGYLVKGDANGASAFIRRSREHGVSAEGILLCLLAPAARRLGRLWEDDQCDFTVVTMGLWRLQRALHELSPAFQIDALPPADGKRVLLAPVPGEQHTFGLHIVAEFFRRAGWEVVDGRFDTTEELLEVVRRQWFAVVGISIACERWLPVLQDAVEGLRARSRNDEVSIILGGPLFLEYPELLDRTDADAVATDARRAVELAQGMVSMQRLAS